VRCRWRSLTRPHHSGGGAGRLPHARIAVDHFHLVKLANDAVTRVRRRGAPLAEASGCAPRAFAGPLRACWSAAGVRSGRSWEHCPLGVSALAAGNV
jgi:Transposase